MRIDSIEMRTKWVSKFNSLFSRGVNVPAHEAGGVPREAGEVGSGNDTKLSGPLYGKSDTNNADIRFSDYLRNFEIRT